jgi:hypothetical protein
MQRAGASLINLLSSSLMLWQIKLVFILEKTP